VCLLDDYRAENARALHITLNGHGEQHIDEIIGLLDDYKSTNAMPVVFHLCKQGYRYQLRSNGGWSFKPNEECLLALQRCLDASEFYFEYQ
ncbi:MAG: hypothetical protein OEN02_13415, partial [Gammaproteobacteria bacterium]|nr:hypothetical protein [Gammaproteobacteria bacterium]